MPIGPGKYDDLATYVRDAAAAEGVVLIVINGAKGSGFSGQLPRSLLKGMPQALRDIADAIDDEAHRCGENPQAPTGASND